MVATIDSIDMASRKKKQLALEGLALVCLYLFLCPIWSMPLYEKIIFFPDKNFNKLYQDFEFEQISRKYHVQTKVVSFSAPDGIERSGWYFAHPTATKVVLVSHGNAGNISNR